MVATGALLAQYGGQKAQRKHEAALSYEGRAWEKKNEGLFEVIAACRGLVDAIDRDDPGNYALAADRTADRLGEWVAVVEVYSSQECRQAYASLRALLDNAGLPIALSTFVENARQRKMGAVDAGDFEEAVKAMRREREIVDEAASEMTLPEGIARDAALRLIEAARASVRRHDLD